MEDEKNLRDVMTEKAMDLLEKTEDMEPGTEKHSRIIEDVVKLSKACNEDYKIECEMYHEEIKIEYDKARDERESQIKVDIEDLKSRRTKANNILLTSVFGGLSVFGFVWEYTGGHIIPGKVSQMMSFIPKAIKL
ncbi:MAG: hypothetical protein K6G85_06395 [Eubacterium sp.]|nr:hypothetical protein [Eubacterium sp.]